MECSNENAKKQKEITKVKDDHVLEIITIKKSTLSEVDSLKEDNLIEIVSIRHNYSNEILVVKKV